MCQDIGSGGAFVAARWPLQADQAFEALDAEFDAPAQAIESKDIGRGEGLGCERGDQDDPFGGGEGALEIRCPPLRAA
jgi:hypothetical protein